MLIVTHRALSRRLLCRFPLVVLQHAAQSFSTPDCSHLPPCLRPRRKQDPIVFALMVALLVVMYDILLQRSPQRRFSNQDQPRSKRIRCKILRHAISKPFEFFDHTSSLKDASHSSTLTMACSIRASSSSVISEKSSRLLLANRPLFCMIRRTSSDARLSVISTISLVSSRARPSFSTKPISSPHSFSMF